MCRQRHHCPLLSLPFPSACAGEGKLAESEFVIDIGLEEELRREADKAVEGSKVHTTSALEVPQVRSFRKN